MSSNFRWFMDTQHSSSFKAEHEKFVIYIIILFRSWASGGMGTRGNCPFPVCFERHFKIFIFDHWSPDSPPPRFEKPTVVPLQFYILPDAYYLVHHVWCIFMGGARVFILVRPILRKVKWHFKSIISYISCHNLVIFKLRKIF